MLINDDLKDCSQIFKQCHHHRVIDLNNVPKIQLHVPKFSKTKNKHCVACGFKQGAYNPTARAVI